MILNSNKDKKVNTMRKMINEDIDVIAEEIIEQCDGPNDDCVIIGEYDFICKMLNWLIKNSDALFVNGELNLPEVDGYDGGYYIIYDCDEIWVAKMSYCDAYKCVSFDDPTHVYVQEEYLSDYLDRNDDSNLTVLVFNDEYEEYDSGEDGCFCVDPDGCGFTICVRHGDNHEKFVYRGSRPLSHSEIENIQNEYFN